MWHYLFDLVKFYIVTSFYPLQPYILLFNVQYTFYMCDIYYNIEMKNRQQKRKENKHFLSFYTFYMQSIFGIHLPLSLRLEVGVFCLFTDKHINKKEVVQKIFFVSLLFWFFRVRYYKLNMISKLCFHF